MKNKNLTLLSILSLLFLGSLVSGYEFLWTQNDVEAVEADSDSLPSTIEEFDSKPKDRCSNHAKYPPDFDSETAPPKMFFKQMQEDLRDTINYLFPESSSPFEAFTASDVFIKCNNENGCWMDVTWIFEGAGYKNVLGWFYFDEETRNIHSDGIQPLFPDVSADGSGGCLQEGDTVRIIIDYNRTVGFWVKADGYDGTPLGKDTNNQWFSVVDYESDGGLRNGDGWDEKLQQDANSGEDGIPTRHFGWVRLANYQQNKDLVLFGFEDLPGLGDRDYNDAMFALQIGPDWNSNDVIRYDPETGVIDQCVEFNPQQYNEYIFTPNCIRHIPLDHRVGQEIKECGAYYEVPAGWEIAPQHSVDAITDVFGDYWEIDCSIGSDANGDLVNSCGDFDIHTLDSADGRLCVQIPCFDNYNVKVLIREKDLLDECSSATYGEDCTQSGSYKFVDTDFGERLDVALYESGVTFPVPVGLELDNTVSSYVLIDDVNMGTSRDNDEVGSVIKYLVNMYGLMRFKNIEVGHGLNSANGLNTKQSFAFDESTYDPSNMLPNPGQALSNPRTQSSTDILKALVTALDGGSGVTWASNMKTVTVVSRTAPETPYPSELANSQSARYASIVFVVESSVKADYEKMINDLNLERASVVEATMPVIPANKFKSDSYISREGSVWLQPITVRHTGDLENIITVVKKVTDDDLDFVDEKQIPLTTYDSSNFIQDEFITATVPDVPFKLPDNVGDPGTNLQLAVRGTGLTVAVHVSWSVAPTAESINLKRSDGSDFPEYATIEKQLIKPFSSDNDLNNNILTLTLVDIVEAESPTESKLDQFEFVKGYKGVEAGEDMKPGNPIKTLGFSMKLKEDETFISRNYILKYNVSDKCFESSGEIRFVSVFTSEEPINEDFTVVIPRAGDEITFDFLEYIDDVKDTIPNLAVSFTRVKDDALGFVEVDNGGFTAISTNDFLAGNSTFRFNSNEGAEPLSVGFNYFVRDTDGNDSGIKRVTFIIKKLANKPPTLSVNPSTITARHTVRQTTHVVISDVDHDSSDLYLDVNTASQSDTTVLRPEGYTDQFMGVSNVSLGTYDLTSQSDVVFEWTPSADAPFNQEATFTIYAKDPLGDVSQYKTVTLMIPRNSPPTFESPQSPIRVTESDSPSPTPINVVGSDIDTIHSKYLDVEFTSFPALGYLLDKQQNEINANNKLFSDDVAEANGDDNTAFTFDYLPRAYECGSDSFDVVFIDDANGVSESATVNIEIACVNQQPSSNNVRASTRTNASVDIQITATDPDEGDSLTLVITELNLNVGDLSFESEKIAVPYEIAGSSITLMYTPTQNSPSNETFNFHFKDSVSANSPPYTGTIVVSDIWENSPPTANDTSIATNEDTAVEIDLTPHFSDADDDEDSDDEKVSRVFIKTLPSNGKLRDTSNNAISANQEIHPTNGHYYLTYVPAPNNIMASHFDWYVVDYDGAQSETAKCTISINAVNDPPTITVNKASVTTQRHDTAYFTVTVADIDSTNINVNIKEIGIPSPSSLMTDGTAIGGYGDDDTIRSITLDSNMQEEFNISWTPGELLPDSSVGSFLIYASDGALNSDSEPKLVVEVAPNDPPYVVGSDDNYTITVPEGFNGTTVSLIGSDPQDYQKETLNVTIESVSAQIGFDPASDLPFNAAIDNPGTAGYTTATVTLNSKSDNYNGEQQIKFRVFDTNGASSEQQTVRVIVTPVNDAPTANDVSLVVKEDTCVQPDSCSNTFDTPLREIPAINIIGEDVDGDILNLTLVSTPDTGVLFYYDTEAEKLLATTASTAYEGTSNRWVFYYQPPPNQFSDCSVAECLPSEREVFTTFDYKVNDAESTSDTYTAEVRVLPVNDPPYAKNLNVRIEEDTSANITLPAFDADRETTEADLSATVRSIESFSRGTFLLLDESEVTLDQPIADRKIVYTPKEDDFSNPQSSPVARLHYTVNDGMLDSVFTYSVTIYVTPLADGINYFGPNSTTIDEDTQAVIVVGERETHWNSVDEGDYTVNITRVPSRGTTEKCYFGDCSPLVDGELLQEGTRIRFTPLPNDYDADEYASFDFTLTLTSVGVEEPSVVELTHVIKVNPINDPPIIVPNFAVAPGENAFDEDTSYRISFSATDIDSPLESLTAYVIGGLEVPLRLTVYNCESPLGDGATEDGCANGTAIDEVDTEIPAQNKSTAYFELGVVPEKDVNGLLARLTFLVRDEENAPSGSATASIRVRPINDAPILSASVVPLSDIETNLVDLDMIGFKAEVNDPDFQYADIRLSLTEESGYGQFIYDGAGGFGDENVPCSLPFSYHNKSESGAVQVVCEGSVTTIFSYFESVRYLYNPNEDPALSEEEAVALEAETKSNPLFRTFTVVVDDLNNVDYREGMDLNDTVTLTSESTKAISIPKTEEESDNSLAIGGAIGGLLAGGAIAGLVLFLKGKNSKEIDQYFDNFALNLDGGDNASPIYEGDAVGGESAIHRAEKA